MVGQIGQAIDIYPKLLQCGLFHMSITPHHRITQNHQFFIFKPIGMHGPCGHGIRASQSTMMNRHMRLRSRPKHKTNPLQYRSHAVTFNHRVQRISQKPSAPVARQFDAL